MESRFMSVPCMTDSPVELKDEGGAEEMISTEKTNNCLVAQRWIEVKVGTFI